jgi:hypothetical protein
MSADEMEGVRRREDESERGHEGEELSKEL